MSGGFETLNFGFVPEADSEIASFLRNTGGLVNIRDSSLPPTAGQILVAIDDKNAAWSNLAEVQSWSAVLALGNNSGTNDVVVDQELQMPTGQALNSTNLLNITEGAGLPTAGVAQGVRAGSLWWDSVGKKMYAFDAVGDAWLPQSDSPQGWDDVLAVDNTSGANNPTINSGQYLLFGGNVRISGNGQVPVTGGTDAVQIGNLAVASDTNTIAVGKSAAVGAAATDGIAIGSNSLVTGGNVNSVALGTGAVTSASNQIMLGTAATTVTTLGKISMPAGVPASTNLLNITSGNGAPTSVGVAEGSLYYDNAGNKLYVFDTVSGWISGVSGNNWATTLANGATSGGTSPVISTGDALRFNTVGTINTVSGADDINVNLGAGKRFYCDKTFVSAQQNGGIALNNINQTVAAGGSPNWVVLLFQTADYSYDDSGATVVDTSDSTLNLLHTNARYHVCADVVLQSDVNPNSVTIPHNTVLQMFSTIDGAPATILKESFARFTPSGNPNATRISLTMSFHVTTSAIAGQYIECRLIKPPNGRFVVQKYRLSAFLMN